MKSKRISARWSLPILGIVALFGCTRGDDAAASGGAPNNRVAAAAEPSSSPKNPPRATRRSRGPRSAGRSAPEAAQQSDEPGAAAPDAASATLAEEVAGRGWIAFSVPTGQGDWDLFVMRPDGSGRRRLTDTRTCSEAGIRFSSDGRRMLYYRLPSGEQVDNNAYGTYELVVAQSDGSRPTVIAQQLHWASWGPGSGQLTGLAGGRIATLDLATGKIVRRLPRHGMVQQTVVSPDGNWLVGTANGLGTFWNIGRLRLADAAVRAVGEADRYNCTPDWMPDSRGVLYARGIVPEVGGFAELWIADGDSDSRRMLYAEADHHIYGACASPDGAYLLFTRSTADMGGRDSAGAQLALIRMADAPMIGRASPALAERYPQASDGPRLDLGEGWEPHWTGADLSLGPATKASNETP